MGTFVELQVIGKPVGVYFRVIRYLVYVLVVKIEKNKICRKYRMLWLKIQRDIMDIQTHICVRYVDGNRVISDGFMSKVL